MDAFKRAPIAARFIAYLKEGHSGVYVAHIDAPGLPTSPIEPDYPMTVASGAVLAGGVVLLLLRSRRRPASATQTNR